MAQKLHPFRLAFLVVAIISLILASYSVVIDNEFSRFALRPAVVGTLWGLLFFAFIQLFQSIPAPVLPLDNFFIRFIARIKLWLYSLLAIIVLTTSILLVWMSLRLLLL